MQRGCKSSDIPFERQRRWHAKVTSGCITCRRRRVKCDEQRPVCKSCSRLKLTCHGNGYGLHASTADANSVSDFHIITPQSYKVRQRSGTSSARTSVSTSSSTESAHTAFQQYQSSRPSSVASTSTRLPSISTILGAARYDPFNTGCVIDVSMTDRRNFDHAVFCQWSNLTTDLSVVRSDIMTYALSDPVVWYAVVYAGATHHAYWSGAGTDGSPRDLTRLSLKTRAVQAMVQAFQNWDGEITDEILISTLILSAHGTGESVRRQKQSKVQSRKSLLKIMDSEYYGALDPGVEHLQTLYKFIERRGGLHMIQSRTVTMATSFFDIWNSWKFLSRPALPMFQSLSEVLTLRTWTLDSKGERSYRRLTESLTPIIATLDLAECTTLLSILEGFRVLITDLDQIRRTPKAESVLSAPDQPVLMWIRSTVMHTLLDLPDYSIQALGSEHSDESNLLIYELCRVSCLMCVQLWLCAVVNKQSNMARKLLSKMWPLLSVSTSRLYDGSTLSARHSDLFLWAVVLSLMCAYEDLDNTGESTSMQKTSLFVRHTQIEPLQEHWPKIANILEKCLWAEFDCDLTGQEAWQQACVLLSVPKRADHDSPLVIRGAK